jgi:hypothetical protein
VEKMYCPSPEYLAGFFDGEGSIYLTAPSVQDTLKCPESRLAVAISLTNTYRPILDAVCCRYGGGITSNVNHRQGNAVEAWTWRAWGIEAGHFLTEVQPFLIQKGGRATAALFYLDTLRWPRDWRSLSLAQRAVRRVALRYLAQNPNPARGARAKRVAVERRAKFAS